MFTENDIIASAENRDGKKQPLFAHTHLSLALLSRTETSEKGKKIKALNN